MKIMQECRKKINAGMQESVFYLSINNFLHSCISAFVHFCIPVFLHSCIPAFLYYFFIRLTIIFDCFEKASYKSHL